MAKLTIRETYMEVEREDGDPKFYGIGGGRGESNFLYYLKGILNKEPYNMGLIKKRMWLDGHLVDGQQQYLRTGKIRVGKPYMMMYNNHWAITGLDKDWNAGKAILAIERGIGWEK